MFAPNWTTTDKMTPNSGARVQQACGTDVEANTTQGGGKKTWSLRHKRRQARTTQGCATPGVSKPSQPSPQEVEGCVPSRSTSPTAFAGCQRSRGGQNPVSAAPTSRSATTAAGRPEFWSGPFWARPNNDVFCIVRTVTSSSRTPLHTSFSYHQEVVCEVARSGETPRGLHELNSSTCSYI